MPYKHEFEERAYSRLRKAFDLDVITIDEYLLNIYYRMSFDHEKGVREKLTSVYGYIPDHLLAKFVQLVEREEPRVSFPQPQDPEIYAQCLQAAIEAKTYILAETRRRLPD